MTVLKCNRCGAVQEDPKDLGGWVEVHIVNYAAQDDYENIHEHWCKECTREMSRTRYADDIRRSYFRSGVVKPFEM